MQQEQELATKKFLYWIIWGGLVFSQFLYLFLVTQVLNLKANEPRDVGDLSLIFAGVSVVLAIGSFVVFTTLLKTNPPLNRAFPFYIVAWVMNESICVFGLLLSMMAFESDRIYPFFAASVVLNLIMYPRLSRLPNA